MLRSGVVLYGVGYELIIFSLLGYLLAMFVGVSNKYIIRNENISKGVFIRFLLVLGTSLTILGIIQKKLLMPLVVGIMLETIIIMISQVVILKNSMPSNILLSIAAGLLSGTTKILTNLSIFEKHINVVKTQKNWWIVVILLLLAVITLIFYELFDKVIKEKYFKVTHILSSISIVAINICCYGFASERNIEMLFILNLIITLMYCVFNLGTLNIFNKYEKNAKDLEYQYYYNKTLDYLMKDLRRFKHDYNNMLAVIGGYLHIKDYDDLHKYFDYIAGNIRYSNYDNNKSVLKVKNAGILGLILYKLDLAYEKKIQFIMNITVEVDELGVKINEFCEILGVLLDNAIEAATETEEKKVELDILEEESSKVFVIKNSVKSKVDIDKIYVREYSTKGQNRGIGLSVVSELLKNNANMYLETKCDNNKFIQKLVLRMKK